jgi:hypothetical protein
MINIAAIILKNQFLKSIIDLAFSLTFFLIQIKSKFSTLNKKPY